MTTNARFETVLTDYSANLSSFITNNGKTNTGSFNSKEFSIIGKNKTTNERNGEGESIFYYSEDFLVQEFISTLPYHNYAYKKELVEIEY